MCKAEQFCVFIQILKIIKILPLNKVLKSLLSIWCLKTVLLNLMGFKFYL